MFFCYNYGELRGVIVSRLYVVGDSTVAKFNDVSYFYPRYGYGTQLNRYFDIEVINLALSGRSSKSYVFDPEYNKLLDSIEPDDYVIIGFGHNDEKYDDSFRFTSANLGIEDESSFKHSLYYNYVEKIIEKHATPILATPVIRITPDNNYDGDVIHKTIYGDYRMAILELCKEKNLLSVDLNLISLNQAKKLPYERLALYHAITKGKMVDGKLVYNEKSIDKTHLSYLGASYYAYHIARIIKDSNNNLAKYVKDNIKEPEISELEINPLYKYIPYITPDLDNYKPTDSFKCDEYYGTAFGNLDSFDGFIANGSNGKYYVGNESLKPHGKINASSEGFSFLFKRINKSDNFIFKAKAKVIKCANARQAGFGLMLRGDSYLNQDNPNHSIVTNYIASGLITTDKVTYGAFSRLSTTDLLRLSPLGEFFYKVDDIVELEIERLGQVVKTKLNFNGKEYNNTFTDYDYYNDDKYLFVGMFGTNGTIALFDNVELKLTGKAIEA